MVDHMRPRSFRTTLVGGRRRYTVRGDPVEERCSMMPRMRRIAMAGGLALALGALTAAAPDSSRGPGIGLTPEIRHFYDSLLTVPDSLLGIPGAPGAIPPSQLRAFARHLLYAPESTYAGPDSAHHTDAQLEARFMARESDFERLARMFRQDSTVDRVTAPEWAAFPEKPLPAARRRDYDRLMAATGVRMLVRTARDRFLFRTTTVWTFDRRGYVWSVRTPSPVVRDETTG